MRTATKPKKITFKHAESEWYNYHQTLREIANLREEIMNPTKVSDDNIGGSRSGQVTSPTEQIVNRLSTNKRLKHLEEIAQAIEQVYNALPNDYKKLCRLRYWSKNRDLTWDGISNKLNISKRQAIRWRDDIIQATVDFLGWR
ncbi:phage transcriptional activator, RinA family [Thalassobacillus cyri]|uniref:Phage transcriptional activator, RinA family n=1 Tax=Thalassobacillus cyri TaxID=571932 RepID=A0A1H4H437_9BACI|nr:transcriptional regulator [Thalassobacillus cyri]SEB15848.1 phage transcriptional activator, RinA family [Thalassobacillus cyri]